MREKAVQNLLLEEEEIKGLKLLLTLFYLALIGFDLLHYYVFPFYINEATGLPSGGLGVWFYILFLPLVILAIYLKKKENVYIIKYVYLIGFIVIDLINNFLIYYDTSTVFSSGNTAELVFTLFSPLFLTKRFFWFSLLGIVGKYIILGIAFHSSTVLLPISLYILLSIFSYILLSRFSSNLQARLKINEELQQAEQLAAIGEIASSITHEVRNPLTSLKGLTQLQKEKHPEDSDYYHIMTNELERINAILEDLLEIGKPKDTNFDRNNMKEMIEYVETIMGHNEMEQRISIHKEIEDDLPEIECNSQQIKQVLINIFKNGMEAMPSGGNLIVHVETWEKNHIKISVKDEGEGISKENLELLGQPFHTTKSEGTGLGLMVTFKIIEDHEGRIHYDSEKGKGTTCTILLPIFPKGSSSE